MQVHKMRKKRFAMVDVPVYSPDIMFPDTRMTRRYRRLKLG